MAAAHAAVDGEGTRMIADFHFLRPEWLWGFVGAAILFWVVSRREDVRARWGSIISSSTDVSTDDCDRCISRPR